MTFKPNSSTVGLALIGAGTVGGGVLDILRRQRDSIRVRCGRDIEVMSIAVRDVAAAQKRLGEQYAPLLTNDWREAVARDGVDIVVEMAGGVDAAGDCIRAALAAEKPVVTANKALLAETVRTDGDVLSLASSRRLPLAHEAAVAGCIPIVKVLREALAGDAVREIYGIINGTCNYILTAMEEEALSFADALKNAQQLGYAEADPELDIDGIDAAHKLSLLSRLAFGAQPAMADIPVAGVRDFDRRDILFARQFNFCVKLLAIAKRGDGGLLELRVRPALIPRNHPLASVGGVKNAVTVRAVFSGETMYYGAGAGAHPTAVAVVADIMDIVTGNNGVAFGDATVDVTPAFSSPHYLRMRVTDRSGVLADITRLLAQQCISIEAIHQNESLPGQTVDVVFLLHNSAADKVATAVADIEKLDAVVAPLVVLPIERLE